MYKFLMAPPVHFKIPPPHEGTENDFLKRGYEEFISNPEGFSKKAFEQWKALKDLLIKLGAEVVELPSSNSDDDFVFTADASLTLVKNDGPIRIFSKFLNEKRQKEVPAHANFFKDSAGPHYHASFYTEGTGDNVYDSYRDVFFSGYDVAPDTEKAAEGRSDKRFHAELEKITSVKVIGLHVRRPFFHIDTSLGILPKGHILAYPDGLESNAYRHFRKSAFTDFDLDPDDYLIEVSKEDAYLFACNVRCVKDTIIIPICSLALQDKIRAKGYNIEVIDVSAFIAAGGAVHCLTNNIAETHVPGGKINKS